MLLGLSKVWCLMVFLICLFCWVLYCCFEFWLWKCFVWWLIGMFVVCVCLVLCVIGLDCGLCWVGGCVCWLFWNLWSDVWVVFWVWNWYVWVWCWFVCVCWWLSGWVGCYCLIVCVRWIWWCSLVVVCNGDVVFVVGFLGVDVFFFWVCLVLVIWCVVWVFGWVYIVVW